MKRTSQGLIAAALVAAAGLTAQGSSHREALAILNEPCADNTDTYAWVSHGSHDKLYLIMDFNPLHEPGQGNQGFRACNGYRYEFHIGKGASLRDQVVYRVEFTNTLRPEAPPEPRRSAGRRQRAALAAHRRHRDHDGSRASSGTGQQPRAAVIGQESAGPSQQPRSADRSARLRARCLPGLRLGRSDEPRASVSTIRLSSTASSTRWPTAAASSPASSTIPYQLDEKGIFDLVNLNRDDLGGIPGARRPPGKDVFTGFNVFSIALEIPIADSSRDGIPHNGQLLANSTDSLLRIWSSISRRQLQIVDAKNIITGLKGAGPYVQVGRNALPLFNAGLVGTQRHTLYLRTNPYCTTSPTSAPTCCFRCWCATRKRSASTRRWACRPYRRLAERAPRRHHQRHQSRQAHSRSPTATPATSSRSMQRSTRASPTDAVLAAERRPIAIR